MGVAIQQCSNITIERKCYISYEIKTYFMIKKIVFKISGMHCTSCTMNIDGELEDTEGVKSASTSYAKQQTEVEFEEDKITLERITEIIKSLGYEASI